MKELLLIGNSFALLVVALELANKGYKISILTDFKKPGGHFAGIEIQGYSFDFGMVMYEGLDNLGNEDDFSTYDPKIRNDWVRFGGAISEWVRSRVDVKRASTPQCLIDGKIYPDYLITNKLDAFKHAASQLGSTTLSVVKDIHPRVKAQSAAYDHLNYYDAASICHGKALHDHYIEPFVQKLLMIPSSRFLARYHRAAWAPLFYPETINQVMNGVDFDIDEYKFWVSKNGFSGQLVSNTLQTLKSYENVRFIEDSVDYLKNSGSGWIASAAGNLFESQKVVLGISVERAYALLGIDSSHEVDSTSVAILFAIVQSSKIKKRLGCLMIVDDEYASYRLTDQDTISGNDPVWHRVTIEANPKYIEQKYNSSDFEKVMRNELRALLGLENNNSLEVLKFLIAKNSLVYPSLRSLEAVNNAFNLLHNTLYL